MRKNKQKNLRIAYHLNNAIKIKCEVESVDFRLINSRVKKRKGCVQGSMVLDDYGIVITLKSKAGNNYEIATRTERIWHDGLMYTAKPSNTAAQILSSFDAKSINAIIGKEVILTCFSNLSNDKIIAVNAGARKLIASYPWAPIINNFPVDFFNVDRSLIKMEHDFRYAEYIGGDFDGNPSPFLLRGTPVNTVKNDTTSEEDIVKEESADKKEDGSVTNPLSIKDSSVMPEDKEYSDEPTESKESEESDDNNSSDE